MDGGINGSESGRSGSDGEKGNAIVVRSFRVDSVGQIALGLRLDIMKRLLIGSG